jgi:WD40 repeat protein
MASYSSPGIYLVGEYGYLQKLDGNLEVVDTGKVPNLVRGCSIRDADISPDGERLFLAVSSDNPLVVVRAADLSVDENVRITFPPTAEPWEGTYFPFSIISTSPRYLYMTDESYSTAPNPFSTVLVDLNAKTAKPIYGYSFMSKMQIQVSPNRKKMALYDGKLYFIDIPTGKVADLLSRELIGMNKWVIWFDIKWDDNIAEFYIIPIRRGEKNLEKVCIDVKSQQIIYREELESKTSFGFYNENSYRRVLTDTSSKIYIQDSKGTIQIFDRQTGKLLETLDYTLFGKALGRPVLSYISPDEKLLFYQKDDVKQISNGKDARDISSFCVMDPETRKTIKTLQFPQKIVAVLFSE